MSRRLAQALFIAACVGLAWYAWTAWSGALPQYKHEAMTMPTVLLYALTLPTSLVVQLLYTGLGLVTAIDRLDGGTAFLNWMFKTWGPLTVAGYLQWLVLVPRLTRYWRSRSADSSV